MRKIVYLSLLIVCAASVQVHAQSASGNAENKRYAHTQKKITFAIQPLQAFNNSLRYDIEVRLGDGPGWLQFGPAFYYNTGTKDGDGYYYEGRNYYDAWSDWQWREPYSELLGFGLDLNYKYFLDARRSFYIAAGLSYTRINIKYLSKTWIEYVEDGLKYHRYGDDYNTQHIGRFGVNNFVGYQIPTRGAFHFDVFGGYAIRHAISDKDKPSFSEDMFSYGYSGIVGLLGFRIGFGLR